MNFTSADLLVAAKTVYGEARGEPFDGKVAVAWVIRNRVEADLGNDQKPDWWGEGVYDVCLKPYQFSCWLRNDPNLPKLLNLGPNAPDFDKCMLAVSYVFADLIPDITNKATHYCVKTLHPAWEAELKLTQEIGNHKFFR